jgi:hypothetical protein
VARREYYLVSVYKLSIFATGRRGERAGSDKVATVYFREPIQ